MDGSTPIINHPEAALLGVGRIVDKPWVVDGQLAVRKVTQLSLTFDHRVCDGGVAGGFLRHVADCVEQPGAADRERLTAEPVAPAPARCRPPVPTSLSGTGCVTGRRAPADAGVGFPAAVSRRGVSRPGGRESEPRRRVRRGAAVPYHELPPAVREPPPGRRRRAAVVRRPRVRAAPVTG